MTAYHRSHPLGLLVVATMVATLNAATAPVSSAPARIVPARIQPVALHAVTLQAVALQAVTPQADRAAHMQVHFSQVMTVHEAVIRGDLAAVRAPATWLAGHEGPSSLPRGSAPFVAQMQRAARRTAQASTVLEAALGTADMLKTCGDCHRGVGTMPAATLSPSPAVGGIVGHMLAHQRSADQMLQGLIVPSSALWRTGADGFSGAPLRAEKLPEDRRLTPELAASERRIHELAAQAGKTDDGGARAVFYGQMIARCADCHALHRKVWGPSRR